MSLTSAEAKQWKDIVDSLARPEVEAASDADAAGRSRLSRRFVVLTVTGFLIVVATLVVGIALQQRIVCAVAWTGVLVGMLVWGLAYDAPADE